LVFVPPQDEGEVEPWTAPPWRRRRQPPICGELPDSLELVLGNQIYLSTSRCRADGWTTFVKR